MCGYEVHSLGVKELQVTIRNWREKCLEVRESKNSRIRVFGTEITMVAGPAKGQILKI